VPWEHEIGSYESPLLSRLFFTGDHYRE
jgi:hypothetical protein